MRVLVCGGRNFGEWRTLAATLDGLSGVTVLMQGGASGTDSMAIKWAETRGVSVITFPANWRSGKKGGPLRNAFMLSEGKPDLVVAFPGGPGTQNMVEQAERAGVPVQRSPS